MSPFGDNCDIYVNCAYDFNISSLNENIDYIISWQHLNISNLIFNNELALIDDDDDYIFYNVSDILFSINIDIESFL